MKFKFRTFLALSLGLGVLGGSLLALRANDVKFSEAQANEGDLTVTDYVPINTNNFYCEGYDMGSIIRSGNETFFDPGRFFGTSRPFINTVNHYEGNTGWIRSKVFNQTGEYISFVMGGNPNFENDHPRNFVNVWSEDHAYNVGNEICNNAFVDADISCNMVFKFVQIPAQYRGRTIIYINDGTTGNFGGVTFGDLRINQTWDDVVEAFSAHLATYALSQNNAANISAYNTIKNLYETDPYYASLRTSLAAKTSADDNFEKQNGMINWAVDRLNSTYPNGDLALLNLEGIISNIDLKQDPDYFQVGMPSNMSGTHYLRPEFESSGVYEDAKYRFVSSEFTLSGSGFISAKLGGGTAVLELVKASDYSTLLSTATAAAEGTNILRPGFVGEANKEQTFNLADSGVRLNTMSRVYLDCHEYVGERVRVALHDARHGFGWGLAYFDDVVTYYENTPSFQVDVCRQDVHYITVPDEYSGAANTDFAKAHGFWRNYLNVVRGGKYGNNYCSSRVSDEIKALLGNDGYNGLTATAKQIVCASVDYERVGSAENYYDKEPVIYEATDTYNIARSIQYLAEQNGVSVTVYNPSASRTVFGIADNSVETMILVIGLSIVCIIACALVLKSNKRRKIEK